MAQILRSPSIQTAAQDRRVQEAVSDYAHRRELRETIRIQRRMIWGLLALLLAGWWLA